MSKTKKILSILLLAIILLSYFFEIHEQINLEALKTNHDKIKSYYFDNNMIFTLSFFTIYVFVTALSIPAATVLTLAGASVMSFSKATIVISFASTIGATLAFLLSRYLFRDWVEDKFKVQYEKANEGMNKNGSFYLLSLRLIPVVPFFVINMVMGLTNIKLSKYYVISQVAMLPATLVYVNAGTELSKINSIKDIISFKIFLSLSLIGLLPYILKVILTSVKNLQTHN